MKHDDELTAHTPITHECQVFGAVTEERVATIDRSSAVVSSSSGAPLDGGDPLVEARPVLAGKLGDKSSIAARLQCNADVIQFMPNKEI